MLLQSLLSDIEKLVSSSVIKYGHKAKETETTDSIRLADMYEHIMDGTDNFDYYPFFDPAAIINAGIAVFDPSSLTGDGSELLSDLVLTVPAEGLSAGDYWLMLNEIPFGFRASTGVAAGLTVRAIAKYGPRKVIYWTVDVYTTDEEPEFVRSFPLNENVDTGTRLYYAEPTPIEIGKSAADYSSDKSLIPTNKRKAVVEAQRTIIIDNYIDYGDLNNYYRMLSGYPNMEDPDLYLTDDEYTALGITESSEKLPVHLLSEANANRLYGLGIISKYIEMYPEYKYLSFLGSNKIDVVKARQSKDFALLKTTADVPSSVYDLFHTLYDQNREYVMNVVYNKDLYSDYDMYDNFMALLIMIMTIQRMVASSFKKAIQRDLYDWQFIKNLYKSYNIPFLEDLTMENHVTLTKNFNRLLQYKGTDKVLFDICSLLGHDEITIEKYFLVKAQKYDINGVPIISQDNEQQYDMYFQAVKLEEDNIALALQDKTNTLSYEEVTEADPYWWDSGDLKNTLLEKEFNYIESKYISLNIMYNMTDVLFDVVYAFRLILDRKTDLDTYGINLPLPRVTSSKDFSLFNSMVFLIAATSMNNGFNGDIPNIEVISHIYGFNFDAQTIRAIKFIVNNNRTKLEKEVVDFFDSIPIRPGSTPPEIYTLTSLDAVNNFYAKIRELRSVLVNAMYTTQRTQSYYIYKKIYDTLMAESNVTSMFTIDGVLYNNYYRYLQRAEPDLYAYIDPDGQYTTADRNSIIEHVLSQLEKYIPTFSEISNIVSDIRPIYNAIVSLVKFFKSYTVDIHSFNVWYLMNDKYFNHIKTLDKIGLITSNLWTKSNVNGIYSDQGYITANITTKDGTRLREQVELRYDD